MTGSTLSHSASDSTLSTFKDGSLAPSVSIEKKSFTIVSLQQTSIAPRESVTYEKQTQTIGHSNERGGIPSSTTNLTKYIN